MHPDMIILLGGLLVLVFGTWRWQVAEWRKVAKKFAFAGAFIYPLWLVWYLVRAYAAAGAGDAFGWGIFIGGLALVPGALMGWLLGFVAGYAFAFIRAKVKPGS